MKYIIAIISTFLVMISLPAEVRTAPNFTPISEEVLLSDICKRVSGNYVLPIHEAIALITQDVAADQIRFEPMLGGGSKAKLFRVDVGDKKYVLRLLDENQPVGQRMSELNAHRIGVELQIAPEIIYADPQPLVILMEFIEGRTLTRDDLDNAEVVKQVVSALKKFHHYSENDSSSYSGILRRTKVKAIHDLYDRYKHKKGVIFPSCYDPLHSKLQEDFVTLKRKHTLSHGDFNRHNILISEEGHIYVIDWACAGIDHPFLDIGWLATSLAANDVQLQGLLREYLEREPTTDEVNEVFFFKDVTAFLLATLWIGRQEERDQGKLDVLLAGPLKSGSQYIAEGVSVEDVLREKGTGLTVYSLGWLKEFIENRADRQLASDLPLSNLNISREKN